MAAPLTDVQRQLGLDLMVTAAEGGSNYWAHISVAEGSGSAYTKVRVIEHEPHKDGQPERDVVIGPEELIAALAVAAGPTIKLRRDLKQICAAAVLNPTDDSSGDFDAEAADVVMQVAVLGDLIYG